MRTHLCWCWSADDLREIDADIQQQHDALRFAEETFLVSQAGVFQAIDAWEREQCETPDPEDGASQEAVLEAAMEEDHIRIGEEMEADLQAEEANEWCAAEMEAVEELVAEYETPEEHSDAGRKEDR